MLCPSRLKEEMHMAGYDLSGRAALVTGGARGLGAGMAEALAKAGAAVVIADIREDLGRATADALKQTGATAAFPGIAGYSATKSAVDRLTRVAAMEAGKLGYGVRVNCVYPGLVPTEMGNQLATDVVRLGLFPSVEDAIGAVVGQTPAGRLGEVTDMADAVVFLASDAARF